MAASLEWAVAEIKKIQSAARSGQPIVKPRWPVLILRTPKVSVCFQATSTLRIAYPPVLPLSLSADMSHYDHHRQESSGSASGDIEKQDISISEDVKEDHGATYEAVDPAADKRCV